MEIKVRWHAPIKLKDGEKENLIYVADGLDAWRGVPGVYMFARMFGRTISPLYVGKAESLGARVWQHFKSNTKLMNQIKKSANGQKVVILGELELGRRQNAKRCIGMIERVLIDYALTEGYELLNVQGTRTPVHKVSFSGFSGANYLTGKSLTFRQRA